MNSKSYLLTSIIALFVSTQSAYSKNHYSDNAMVTMQSFGSTKDGKPVLIYSLTNQRGMRVDISNYGATVVRIFTEDRNGNIADVALGFDTVREYEEKSPYFGCIVGRYGNRIANGKFKIGKKTYKLATNNKPGGIPCSLHGGLFDPGVSRIIDCSLVGGLQNR